MSVLSSVAGAVSGVIEEYIILPMKYGTGYNPVNTAFVAAMLVAFSYLSYRLLEGIRFDRRFCISVLPYIAAGSLLRAMKDHGLVESLVFITPWIWLLLLVPAVVMLRIFKNPVPLAVAGTVALILLLPQYRFSNIHRLAQLATVFQALLILSRILSLIPVFRRNMFYLVAQFFDASTTFVGVSNGFFEQHVLARFAMGLVGPAGIFLVKIPLLYLVFSIIERESGREREFMLFLVFLVAIGPGLRNMFTTIY